MFILTRCIATAAITFTALLFPMTGLANAADATVAGAPGLAHVIDGKQRARCEAAVVSSTAVLVEASCVMNGGKVVPPTNLQVAEGDSTQPVRSVWIHPGGPQANNLALLTVGSAMDSDVVALDTLSLNYKLPALASNLRWVQDILSALATAEVQTDLAEPGVRLAPMVPSGARVNEAATVHFRRHFLRVQR